jgi:Spy/CpxP family protein refolding chaperone
MHPFHGPRHCAPRAVTICHGFGAMRGHRHRRRAWETQAEQMDDDFGAGGFGVRRPLRFLAHKLALDDRQVAELARILDELKTERAQAEVDRRRTLSVFADALTGDAFDDAKAGEGGDLRVKSAERLRAAVLKALKEIHALLNPEQRSRLAYLIRTGTLAV